jgi:putative FmdB family regulatory protein
VPLYEYECQACKHRFERIQQYSDPIVKKCPKCGKKRVKKLLSSPAIQFKGSGFYITDYQRKGTGASLPDHSESGKTKDTADKAQDKGQDKGQEKGQEKGQDKSDKAPKGKSGKKD